MAGPPFSLPIDSPRVTGSSIESPSASSPVPFIIAYNVLQMLGFVLLVPVILTAWVSPRVHRASTWFPFMLSWVFSTIIYSFLMVHQIGPSPSFALCLTQAGFVYASPALISLTGVAFLLQIYSSIYSAIKITANHVAKSRLLFFLPISIATGVFIYILTIGLHDPDNVQRSPTGMYCHLGDERGYVPSFVDYFKPNGCLIAYLLYRNWSAYRRLREMDAAFSLSTLVRVTIFGFLPLFALIINFLAYEHRNSPIERGKINVTIATLPLLAGLVFGTQRDILRTWFFSIHPTSSPRTMVSIHIEKSVA
ncbi:hypothetical protein BDN72DRAFT_892523 [Pluteus cervinus]|uniref:Uncharacterized protein n=1 Tax=Pluteus cervinus TaxID=181527 RepID=A0ACD3BAJ3_9AGAR|nr:hypothetical protein BDN72DRAFT_892523 [Pluteus cervinus]